MAKKSKNNSINLLKGITGSKLAKLLTIAAIVLAIPLTVFMSQKQQNTEQEAASSCAAKGGSCINTEFTNVVSRCLKNGGSIQSNLCPGKSNIKCCVPAKTTAKTCSDYNGKCLDLNKYNCTITMSNLCPGKSNIKCCVGNYYPKSTTTTKAATKQCSRCSTTYKYCKAYWKEGDSNCDRNKIIGATTYKKDSSCTSGTDKGYCP